MDELHSVDEIEAFNRRAAKFFAKRDGLAEQPWERPDKAHYRREIAAGGDDGLAPLKAG